MIEVSKSGNPWRISAAAAVLLAPMLLLTGCGGGAEQSSADAALTRSCPSSEPAAPTAVDTDSTLPTVSGSFGHLPMITAAKGAPTGKFVVKVLSEGSGRVVGKGDIVGFDLVGQTWSGKTFVDTYKGGSGAMVDNLRTTPMAPMFTQAVVGHKVGSRVLVVAPPAAGFGNTGNPQYGINCHDTLSLIVDIVSAAPGSGTAEGIAQSVPANLPKVTMGNKEAATFTITDAQRNPRKLGVGVLIKGNGPVVEPGQKLIVQYTGALLKNGTVFGSSWANGGAASFVIGKGQVIAGWDKGLVGQTVGSRVILSIPAADGYGSRAYQSIPANSNLVFVVDILSAA